MILDITGILKKRENERAMNTATNILAMEKRLASHEKAMDAIDELFSWPEDLA